MPRLENWSVVPQTYDPYKAPEQWIPCLEGCAYAHCKFKDSQLITTSRIVGKRGDKVITFSDSEYELGDVNPTYEKFYPNAKERLLKSLKEV